MSIIFFIFAFLFIIAFFVLSAFSKILSFFFGGSKKQSNQSYQDYYTRNNGNEGYSGRTQTKRNSEGRHSKIFSKDEGEYVNYEEIE